MILLFCIRKLYKKPDKHSNEVSVIVHKYAEYTEAKIQQIAKFSRIHFDRGRLLAHSVAHVICIDSSELNLQFPFELNNGRSRHSNAQQKYWNN